MFVTHNRKLQFRRVNYPKITQLVKVELACKLYSQPFPVHHASFG